MAVPTSHPAGPPPAFGEFARFFGYYVELVPTTSGAPLPVSPLLGASVVPLTWLLMAAAFGGILFWKRDEPLLPACWAGLTGMAFGSIVLSLIVLLASGGLLVGQVRYGLGVLPLYAIPLMCLRHPVATAVIVFCAGGSLLSHLLLW